MKFGNDSEKKNAKNYLSIFELDNDEFDFMELIFIIDFNFYTTHQENKNCWNYYSLSTTCHGLIPDITVSFLKPEVEILVVEHSKSKCIDNVQKNLNDTIKLAILI
nr:121_t:CDS:2 [Entrophospora candida]